MLQGWKVVKATHLGEKPIALCILDLLLVLIKYESAIWQFFAFFFFSYRTTLLIDSIPHAKQQVYLVNSVRGHHTNPSLLDFIFHSCPSTDLRGKPEVLILDVMNLFLHWNLHVLADDWN